MQANSSTHRIVDLATAHDVAKAGTAPLTVPTNISFVEGATVEDTYSECANQLMLGGLTQAGPRRDERLV